MTERRPADPWPDERLDSAFKALPPAAAPGELAETVMTRVDGVAPRRWNVSRRAGLGMLAAAAALVVLAVAFWPWATRGGPFVAAPLASDPPSATSRVFAAETFRFAVPEGWTVTEVGPRRGAWVLAVLGTLPVPASCGLPVADINCVYRQRLEPGTVRVFVGSEIGFGRLGTVFDRVDPDNATTTRLTVAGRPAILDDYGDVENYYQANVWLRLAVAAPGTLRNGPWFEVFARDPDSAEARAAFDALVSSLTFTPPGAPPSPDVTPTTGPDATDAPRDSTLGLPLMTVDEALAFIATYPGDVEMAVQGWWASPPTPIPCPYAPDSDSSPVFPRCPDGESYLMAEPQSIFTTNPDGSGTSHTPVGAYLQPLLRDGAAAPATLGPLVGEAPSVPVIVLGHVGDHRAASCSPDDFGRCEAAFVADLVFAPDAAPPVARVDLLDDMDQAGGAVTMQPPVHEDLAVAAARRTVIGADLAPLVAVLRVTPGTLPMVDPTIGVGEPGDGDPAVIWVVRLLVTDPNGAPHVRTFAMDDRELLGDVVTVYQPLGGQSVSVNTSP